MALTIAPDLIVPLEAISKIANTDVTTVINVLLATVIMAQPERRA